MSGTVTKAERNAINSAWRSIQHLCECTNWSDAPAWREAEKLERRETKSAPIARVRRDLASPPLMSLAN